MGELSMLKMEVCDNLIQKTNWLSLSKKILGGVKPRSPAAMFQARQGHLSSYLNANSCNRLTAVCKYLDSSDFFLERKKEK